MESLGTFFCEMFANVSSRAIVFSVAASSFITLLVFFLNQRAENKRVKRKTTLEKIELLFSKVDQYSRIAKSYLWSYKIEGQEVRWSPELATHARELVFECATYKDLYFPSLEFDPAWQYAELERVAGRCHEIWITYLNKLETILDESHEPVAILEEHKLIAEQVCDFDRLLKPVRDQCLAIARTNT
jgi:hypothetical protein